MDLENKDRVIISLSISGIIIVFLYLFHRLTKKSTTINNKSTIKKGYIVVGCAHCGWSRRGYKVAKEKCITCNKELYTIEYMYGGVHFKK